MILFIGVREINYRLLVWFIVRSCPGPELKFFLNEYIQL